MASERRVRGDTTIEEIVYELPELIAVLRDRGIRCLS